MHDEEEDECEEDEVEVDGGIRRRRGDQAEEEGRDVALGEAGKRLHGGRACESTVI